MEKMEKDQQKNRVVEIYKDQTIFLTGGTGFMGKVLIEKLLRVMDVKMIYILVREKRGKSGQERIDDIFSNMLFDKLKEMKPDAVHKVKPINGDATITDLGISKEDREKLQNEVNFIFNLAASTRFDETVLVASRMNLRSARYALDLAKECKKLKCFAHLSTAYAFPSEHTLYEKYYPPPCDPQKVLDYVDKGIEDPELSKKFSGDYPNTYALSKALAEDLVYREFDKIPAIILRPTIVAPSLHEPLPGWCNNLQNPFGILVGAGKGIIRSMHIKPNSEANFIPVDFAINGTVLAPWFYLGIDKNHRIINIAAPSKHIYSWEDIIEEGRHVIYNVLPLNGCVWYPGGSLKKYKWVHDICFYLFQLLPAIFLDFLLIILGYKPLLFGIQMRIRKAECLFEFYTSNKWTFLTPVSAIALKIMTKNELETFPIELDHFSVRQYITDCVRTIRRNNLKEPDETIPGAKRHMFIMYCVDRIVTIALTLLCLYYLYQWILKLFGR